MSELQQIFNDNPTLTDEQILSLYRTVEVTSYKLIASDSLTALLKSFGLLKPLYLVANKPEHPAFETVYATMLRLGSNSEFSFDPNSAIGAGNIASINELATVTMTEYAAQINGFLATADSIAKSADTPYINTTLHEVKLARGTIDYKPVTKSGNYAVIDVLTDVEKHNPRLLATNQRTGKKQRIGNFMGVEVAGKYDCIIPPEWRSAELSVDDAYGAM